MRNRLSASAAAVGLVCSRARVLYNEAVPPLHAVSAAGQVHRAEADARHGCTGTKPNCSRAKGCPARGEPRNEPPRGEKITCEQRARKDSAVSSPVLPPEDGSRCRTRLQEAWALAASAPATPSPAAAGVSTQGHLIMASPLCDACASRQFSLSNSGPNLMCADGSVPRVRRLAASTSAPRRIASCREPWQLQRQPLPETTARWEFACGWPPQKKPQRHRARSRRMLICPARCAPLRSRRTSGPAWLLRPDTLGQKEEWCDSAGQQRKRERNFLECIFWAKRSRNVRETPLGWGGALTYMYKYGLRALGPIIFFDGSRCVMLPGGRARSQVGSETPTTEADRNSEAWPVKGQCG